MNINWYWKYKPQQPENDDMAKKAAPRNAFSGDEPAKRTFDTGATRDLDVGKLDFEGFLSPLVLERYAQYLNKHRKMADGSFRDSDNWQKGIPLPVYMKSAWRHFMAWWKAHRNPAAVSDEEFDDDLCAVMFNTMGYLHERLKTQGGAYRISDTAP